MREYVPGDRVVALHMPSLGVGIIEMALSPSCILVGFETPEGPYHEAFDAAELELSNLIPAR